MKITIGGDFCVTPSFLTNKLIDDDIIELFENSDYRILNLECPIEYDASEQKIIKTGPHLKTQENIFYHLNQLKIDAVTLANNHILDYGEKGLQNTIVFCEKHKIRYVGAGINNLHASEPLIILKENLKIAIINFCENEWSIATHDTAGANPLDIIENYNQIKRAKQSADFVIVIVHGGHEYYQLPSPRMVKQYRFYAENGADAIIGHHTHRISGYEVYKNVPIAYSLGNMLFTLDSKMAEWYKGLIAELRIEKNKPIQLNLIPVKQLHDSFILSFPNNIENYNILKDIANSNQIIANPIAIESEWNKFIEKNNNILNILYPTNNIYGRYLRAIINRVGLNNLLLTRRYLKSILNHIRCEAHRDVLIELLVNKILKK